jgi:hypothetical protein
MFHQLVVAGVPASGISRMAATPGFPQFNCLGFL